MLHWDLSKHGLPLGRMERNQRKGASVLRCCDWRARRVSSRGRQGFSETFVSFVKALEAHKGHPRICEVAIDLSAAYRKGVEEKLGNAGVIFDKFQ